MFILMRRGGWLARGILGSPIQQVKDFLVLFTPDLSEDYETALVYVFARVLRMLDIVCNSA